MTSMNLETLQKNFPLDLSHLQTITDPAEYNRELHEAIRGQLKQGDLISPTQNVTNFQLEPEGTPSFIENIMSKVMSANPAVHDSEEMKQNYLQRRFEFIGEGHEGWREKVYKDSRNLRTVGFGFNLDESSNRDLYKRALRRTDQDFDNLRDGNTQLTMREGRILFEASAGAAERLISSKFSDIDLKGYERLALVSLAYNHPGLIGPNLTKHVRAGDKKMVIDEIVNRSNRHKIKGIDNRRAAEAEMFSGGHTDESSDWSLASLFGVSPAKAGSLKSSDDLMKQGRLAPRPKENPRREDVQQDTPRRMLFTSTSDRWSNEQDFETTARERLKKASGGSPLASIIPSNIRSLASDLLGFDMESVRTEDYFSDGEKNAMRTVVLAAMKRSGRKKSGGVKYGDYKTGQEDVRFDAEVFNFISNAVLGSEDDHVLAHEYIVKTTLGRFAYRIDDRGHLLVVDQFNFNDAEKLQKENPSFSDKWNNWKEWSERPDVGPYGSIRRIGGLWGSKENDGAKFEIDLGPMPT